MADIVISTVVERLKNTVLDQIQNEINLVKGVKKEVLSLAIELKTIRNVLDDAERRRFNDNSVKDWLKRLEAKCYDMDDLLDEWDFDLLKLQLEQSNVAAPPKQKVCSFVPSPSCLYFKKVAGRRNVAKKIKQVKAQLDQILKEKDKYSFAVGQSSNPSVEPVRVQSTSFVEVKDIQGRDHDKDNLLSKLLPMGTSQEESGIPIISVVGSGGIGKTALTQLIYNDDRVKDCYPLRIWICVSNPFDPKRIAKEIVQNVQKNSLDTNQLNMLLEHLRNSIGKKKFLLVLDDVWTENYAQWEPLKVCLNSGRSGSKIVVTTRKEGVAKMMGCKENEMYKLDVLSDEDCWLLLRRIALSERSESEREKFENIGKKIAKKCRGLPLAAKTLGSMLRLKPTVEEWENVLGSDVWELQGVKDILFHHLILSYNELSPALKHCFSYCAILPKDFRIEVEDLIKQWWALGYLDSDGSEKELLRGQEYFKNLAMRSLFHEFQMDEFNEHIVECKMHDMIHDFAHFLRYNPSSSSREQETCQICDPSLDSNVKEYRTLLCEADPPSYICDCLISLRVLKLSGCLLECIPKGIEKLVHLRYLDLSYNENLGGEDLKIICNLYKLKVLILASCNLQEISRDIGKLTRLIQLDLSYNKHLKELPESMGHLHELEWLNVNGCKNLSGFPRRLINLKHLRNYDSFSDKQFPDQVLGQLTGLRTLSEFKGRLSYLKNLNQLSGYFYLIIPRLSGEEDVIEAKEAEMHKIKYIKFLTMQFHVDVNPEKDIDEGVWMGVIRALEPHRRLRHLTIDGYGGSKLPSWITSPLNKIKKIYLSECDHLSLLPPFGKLPCLEELRVTNMRGLESVGRDFLGITATSESMDVESPSSSVTSAAITPTMIGFPALKILAFRACPSWKEWEDITAVEEDSTALSLMPCLEKVEVNLCEALTVLPHRLLRKAASLKQLHIVGSPLLRQHYDEKEEGSAWASISHIRDVGFFETQEFDSLEQPGGRGNHEIIFI